VVATGVLEIGRQPLSTGLRWRPTLRLSPLMLLAALIGLTLGPFGPTAVSMAAAMWSVMYLGMLLWTLHKLPAIYHSVSAQLVARARDRAPR
jgi:predicted metal-binding membrane protein